MRNPMRIMGPLAALALSACSGGGAGEDGGAMPPPASNSAPTIAGLAANASVLQDSSSDPIGFEIGDAETAADQLEVTVSSSDDELLPVAGIQLSGSGSGRSLLLMPEAGQSGTADITVAVKDAGGMTSTQKLTLEITAEQKSFREFALASLEASSEAQPAEVAGADWVEKEEDDPSAFDSALSVVAE